MISMKSKHQVILRGFVNKFLTCGLSTEEYLEIRQPICEQNRKTLQWISLLVAILMLILTGLTFLTPFQTLSMNRYIYLNTGIDALVFALLSRFYLPRHSDWVLPVFYLFLSFITMFCIAVGIVTNTAYRGSTICVLLLAIPLLLIDKPYRVSAFQIITCAAYCVVSYRMKETDVFISDLLNCICILMIAVGITIASQNVKFYDFWNRFLIEQYHIRKMQKQEAQLEESRIAIMLSQIQPHFLYNALTAIARLCDLDPAKAKKTTLNFSDYLRGNLDSLTQTQPIPFSRELKHTQLYTDIETVRFGDKLYVKYDIQAMDFLIPSLTVQPLVENAVKYGVGRKKEGGTVVLSTWESEGGWHIAVRDDGVGFDPHQTQNDGRSHIGIENVKRRLAMQSGGTLRIESRLGEGTLSEIFIPKRGDAI